MCMHLLKNCRTDIAHTLRNLTNVLGVTTEARQNASICMQNYVFSIINMIRSEDHM